MSDIYPAFPINYETADESGPLKVISKGMSLRDYFAAQAMITIIPQPRAREDFDNFDAVKEMFAKVAYSMADAMMKQREADESALPQEVKP